MNPPRRSLALFFSVLALAAPLREVRAADDYPLGPDSQRQPGVPEGDVLQFTFDSSAIFPGTTRDVRVYVPKQYDPAKPACVYVGQDGVRYEAPVVFDNLIHRGEIPVLIGVFAMHGRIPAPREGALDRFNRSYEYDGLGDNFARFVLEELLPAVEKLATPDGRPIRLSKNGNDRMIAGQSSGAAAAFTAAWERPDAFSRVFCNIGTFVGIRGADRYPTLVRKTEPKPIRVFLQDGENDNNRTSGDWWMANQTIQRALVFSGYEVNHVWGDGGHTTRHGSAVFPDALRWLWRDWPAPVKTGAGSDELQAVLLPGEPWREVGGEITSSDGPAVNARGEVFVSEPRANRIWKIALDGSIAPLPGDAAPRIGGQAFGPDGRRYAVIGGEEKVVAYAENGDATTIAEGFRGNDIVVLRNGNAYVTESGEGRAPSRVWLITPAGEKRVIDEGGVIFANGVTASPDQTLLYVADYRSHWVWVHQIQADGSLKFKQRFYHLFAPDTADDAGADGIRVDREGRLYVATRMGVQVCDQAGKVMCLIPTPNGRISNLTFGGAEFDTLYATCGPRLYARKMKTRGAHAWDEPNTPARPRL